MEELIKVKLSTDADYETLNSSLGLMYQIRREFTVLLELNHDETASRMLDVIEVCLNLSRDTGEEDAMSASLPEDVDCPLFISNMTTKLQNFSEAHASLDSLGLIRFQNILEGNDAASQLREQCSNALQNTSQLFDSFRTVTDWITELLIVLSYYSYSTDDDAQEEYSDYFNDDVVGVSLNRVFSLLKEFPVQDPGDVTAQLRDSCSFLDVRLKPLKDDVTAAMETINGVHDAHARVKPLLRRWARHVIVHRKATNHPFPVYSMLNEFMEQNITNVISRFIKKNMTKLELANYFSSERFSQEREEFISNTTDMVVIMTRYRYLREKFKFLQKQAPSVDDSLFFFGSCFTDMKSD